MNPVALSSMPAGEPAIASRKSAVGLVVIVGSLAFVPADFGDSSRLRARKHFIVRQVKADVVTP